MLIKGLLDTAERVRNAHDLRQQQITDPAGTGRSQAEGGGSNSESEEFPKPFSLRAADGELCLLLVVHS